MNSGVFADILSIYIDILSLSILSFISCPSCHWYPVFAILSLISCLWYPVIDILSLPSCHWYPVFDILSLLSCHWYPVFAILSLISCPWYPVIAILSLISLSILSLISCLCHPVICYPSLYTHGTMIACVLFLPPTCTSEALQLPEQLTRIPLLLRMVQPAIPYHRRRPL